MRVVMNPEVRAVEENHIQSKILTFHFLKKTCQKLTVAQRMPS